MSLLWPKPDKPIRGGVAAKRHMDAVAQQPCVACASWPVQLHHCRMGRFAQRKSSDFEVIPLCKPCHDALEANPTAWREMHGRTDFEFLPLVRATMNGLPQ